MTAHGVAERLGGTRVLAREIRTDLDLAEAIGEGLPVEALDAVIHSGILTATEIYDLVIPRRTLAHRRAGGQRLTTAESDRLARVVRTAARAEEAIGDATRASRWLRKPNRALQGQPPLDLIGSDAGARAVDRVLGGIEHGLVA